MELVSVQRCFDDCTYHLEKRMHFFSVALSTPIDNRQFFHFVCFLRPVSFTIRHVMCMHRVPSLPQHTQLKRNRNACRIRIKLNTDARSPDVSLTLNAEPSIDISFRCVCWKLCDKRMLAYAVAMMQTDMETMNVLVNERRRTQAACTIVWLCVHALLFTIFLVAQVKVCLRHHKGVCGNRWWMSTNYSNHFISPVGPKLPYGNCENWMGNYKIWRKNYFCSMMQFSFHNSESIYGQGIDKKAEWEFIASQHLSDV